MSKNKKILYIIYYIVVKILNLPMFIHLNINYYVIYLFMYISYVCYVIHKDNKNTTIDYDKKNSKNLHFFSIMLFCKTFKLCGKIF